MAKKTKGIVPGGEYTDESFDALDCSDKSLNNTRFYDCRFSNCDFSGSDLTDCQFLDCEFENCNFSNTRVDQVTFNEGIFLDSKLQGIPFNRCKTFVIALGFTRCQILMCDFSELQLPDTNFNECQINDCDFVKSELAGADFSGSDLKGSIFQQTDLSGCNFLEAKNYAMDPWENKLANAKFSLPEVLIFLKPLGIKVE